MTDDEARAILSQRWQSDWINWDEKADVPLWWKLSGDTASITLDGDFTKAQLLAILHFADRAK